MLYNLFFWYTLFFYIFILSYLAWGFVVAFEIVLAMSGSKAAVKWLKEHYSYRLLYAEVVLFYPMILLGYLFLELIPHYIFGQTPLARFDLQKLFERLFKKK